MAQNATKCARDDELSTTKCVYINKTPISKINYNLSSFYRIGYVL